MLVILPLEFQTDSEVRQKEIFFLQENYFDSRQEDKKSIHMTVRLFVIIKIKWEQFTSEADILWYFILQALEIRISRLGLASKLVCVTSWWENLTSEARLSNTDFNGNRACEGARLSCDLEASHPTASQTWSGTLCEWKINACSFRPLEFGDRLAFHLVLKGVTTKILKILFLV